MIKSFKDLGSVGVIYDTDPRNIPDNAWSAARNVRFIDNAVEKSKGESEVFTTPTIDPYWLLPVQTDSVYYWAYPSLTKCYVTDGTTNTNITRQTATAITAASVANPTVITAAGHGITDQDTVVIAGDTTATPAINGTHTATVLTADTFTIPVNVTVAGTDGTVTADTNYSADADIGWNGGILGGVPVINNGVDDPQMWTPIGTSTNLASLTWASGQTWSSQSMQARVIRPFKQFLVALDITTSGTRARQEVRWSHPADSGTIPSTWDETDTTKDAGQHFLDEDGGSLIDCLPLGDTNIIYKDSQTIGMQHIGGQFIFRFYNIFKESGLLTRRCVKPFYNQHFCVTNGDVITHDGNTITPILTHKVKDWLFSAIDTTNYARTYVSPNYQKNEIWICFPQSGDSFATLALIWNYRDNTTTVRELPTVKHIGYGLVDPAGDQTWNNDSEAWDLDATQWGETDYSPSIIKNLFAGSTKFYLGDDTEQSDGASITSYVERTGLDFDDPNTVKYIKRIWPRFAVSGDITFSVGQQMDRGDAVTWKNYTFSDGDAKIDVDVSGRFIGFKVSSDDNVTWTLNEFDVEYEYKGRF